MRGGRPAVVKRSKFWILSPSTDYLSNLGPSASPAWASVSFSASSSLMMMMMGATRPQPPQCTDGKTEDHQLDQG